MHATSYLSAPPTSRAIGALLILEENPAADVAHAVRYSDQIESTIKTCAFGAVLIRPERRFS